jgi:aspartate oxidase
MNENNWEEKFSKADLYEREYGCDGANQDYCCGGCSYSYLDEDKVKKFISQTLQQQREEMKKEILNEINEERDRIWSEIEEWCLDHDVERDEYLARIIFDKPVGDYK